MAERSRSQPRGRDFLVSQGIPTHFLRQMRFDGLTPDYFNYFVGTEAVLGMYNPRSLANRLGDSDAGEVIRTRLRAIPSYTEYWQNKIGTDFDNPEEVTTLITSAYPGSQTLDFITRTIRKSANDPSLSPEDLIRRFIILTSMAYRKLDSSPWGLARIKRMRSDFGVGPDISEE